MKRGRDDAADPATTAAKKTTSPSDGVTGIASLPASALSLVWSYAVSMKISDDVCANAEHQLFQMNVHDLQLVCRSWRETIQEILREKLRGVAVVDVAKAATAHGDATSPLELSLASLDKTSPVTDVRVSMGDIISGQDVNDRVIWSEDEQPLIAVRVQRDMVFHKTQPEIDWEKALAPHAETITRLDLSQMLLYSKELGALLRAAAKLCPNVKAVILPPAEKKMYKNEDVRAQNLDALCAALKAWHASNGGLTHLRLPFTGINNLIASVMVLSAITRYCPDIEHLDGWRFTFIEQANLEFVTCDDYWLSPPELFEKMWETCSKLKSFNSVVLPFHAEFYSQFAEVEQPHLEELVFSYNSLTAAPSEELDAECFEEFVQNVPALRSLSLLFGDAHESDWSASNAFDDRFFLAVAKHCPKLEKLSVKCFADLEKVTIASLAALLQLDHLKAIEMRHVAELGDGFVDLLAQRVQARKHLRLRLTVTRMRDLIWKVLALVGGLKPEQLRGASLSLSLKTREAFGFVVPAHDKENARLHEADQVKELVDAIKRVHGGSVRVHLHTTLPSPGHGSKCVLFDSLELSINDPQGFCCTRDKFVEIGNDDVEQELCGDGVRRDGVFARDPEGVLEDVEYLTYRVQKRPRKLFYPDLLSDDDDDEYEGRGMFGGDDDDDDDDEFGGGEIVFDDGDDDDDDDGQDDDDDDDEDDGEDEDGGDEDAGDIFGSGEEDE